MNVQLFCNLMSLLATVYLSILLVRYVGLTWSLFLLGHLYLRGQWLENGHQKDIMCYNEIGVCVQVIHIILSSIVNMAIGRASVMT